MTSSRILVVEDEKHLAEGLRFNLEAEGYEVEVVMDGGAALELLVAQNTSLDAIVLDVMLPEVNGFVVAQTMREAENFTLVVETRAPVVAALQRVHFIRKVQVEVLGTGAHHVVTFL